MSDVGEIVNVRATVRSGYKDQLNFGATLFVTTDSDVLDAGGSGKSRLYRKFSDVADDFDSTSEVYKAAEKYFGQEGAPPPNVLYVARRVTSTIESQLIGSAPDPLATIKAKSGVTKIRHNDEDIAIDVSGAIDYSAIAVILTSAIDGYTFTFSDGVFSAVIDTDTIPFGTETLLDDSVTDSSISDELGLTVESGARISEGSEIENSTSDTLDNVRALGRQFYFVTLETSFLDTDAVNSAAAWAAANDAMLIAETSEVAALASGDTSSRAATLFSMAQSSTVLIYSRIRDYKSLAVAAHLSAVSFYSSNSLITLKFKSLTGCTPDSLNQTQMVELIMKRVNFYSLVGNTPIFREGFALKGFADTQYWLDWFVQEVRSQVYSVLTSSGSVKQTKEGVAILKQTIQSVCQTGIQNGGIAPGQLTPALQGEVRTVTGDIDFDGNLSTGYLVYIPPLASQSQSEREGRTAPTFRVWIKGSGAVHFVNIDIILEQ